MTTTNHIGITLVEQSQAQKEVTVNQAFTRIDALLNTGALSRTTNTPGAEFGRWVYGGGKKLEGLVRRRALEAALFNQNMTIQS